MQVTAGNARLGVVTFERGTPCQFVRQTKNLMDEPPLAFLFQEGTLERKVHPETRDQQIQGALSDEAKIEDLIDRIAVVSEEMIKGARPTEIIRKLEQQQ